MAAEGGVGGSDESFISFAFAVTSVILIALYIPWMVGTGRRVMLYYQSTKKEQASTSNPLNEMYDSVAYIPRVLYTMWKDPAAIVAGAKVCVAEKVFFLRCVMPKFLKFVIRPRILVPILWFVLLTSAMYASLTFDPYAVLGLPSSASTAEVKKTYRALSKRFHPDHNKTEGARELYMQMRRAYRALVDRQAFEEEELKNVQEFSVGVALPRFLTSREHDSLVLFSLLALLIATPIFVWYKFTNDKKVPRLLWHVRFDKERVEHFMQHFGVPVDGKYAARRASRHAILRTLIALNIVPPNVREDVVSAFPPLPDFVQRCVEAERNATLFRNLGLDEKAVAALQAYMAVNGVALVDEYEAANPHMNDDPKADDFQRIPLSAYRATRYLFQQHTVQVDGALAELQVAMGGNLPSAKKLLNIHAEIYDLLDMVYLRNDKANKQLVLKLIAMPQRVSDIVDAIEPEMQLVYHRYYKNYVTQIQQQQRAARAGHANQR
ncbi:putative mitochondrial chaperone protein DNAj [Leptomonas pyrrhocoris]|uniref:Putative mitochondrial chaperone protein DNAj n=1 Tax=Leptomonas pyrrhocoris TaxID=157538 RepID=A0A0M9GAW8_LEPPY|nr:putative mitochondrial chaperone protein DNAj [Leptomonas pyrrhocoris]XP_015665009.1 putative mitochondrial chaperone protein DNAj [Leptomonas pyrrhocoris]XP_015665010.1 putative mitochondrial chaperone protein DNAj [Leptomonas pyrrhocoris]KPA86569.1 putative mitochondrial chaperone protein DNAj [Leptomonas pyrrhocoris]KPA86570.1 putative mitochondrial chaperone protein DNAj [Leptomonas pyrrhocoris]KPA86571.1 putative mitochondrial chaperone protein DNAj [Leptomonas pyrrhocoris]|eukprot:XP_015665008.1 putative mitochondrial chaperone protein DNAj [Leptomonas pyrrhocoris]